MRRALFQILFLNMLFSSCSQNSGTEEIKIKPLHPYSASPYYYEQSETKEQNYINKYFFIERACKSNNELATQVDSFVIKFVQSDSDYKDFGSYNLYFYRKTKAINENFREVTDGRISHNLLSDYGNELLFDYTWSRKDFTGCNFYKGGKVIKTVYDKGRGILKRNPALPLPTNRKVDIKDMPE